MVYSMKVRIALDYTSGMCNLSAPLQPCLSLVIIMVWLPQRRPCMLQDFAHTGAPHSSAFLTQGSRGLSPKALLMAVVLSMLLASGHRHCAFQAFCSHQCPYSPLVAAHLCPFMCSGGLFPACSETR